MFLALPAGESAPLAAGLDPAVRVVDLGPDFRLSHASAWARHYQPPHAAIAALVSFGEAPPFGLDACDPQPVTSKSSVATAMPHAGAVNRSLAGTQGRRTNMAVSSLRPLIMPAVASGAQADSPNR